MNKERLKNLILTTLLLSTFFLTSQIWFNKKLWPDGYNFFDYAENLPLIGRFFRDTDSSADISESIAQLSVPYKAVVTNEGKREVFTPDQQGFDTVNSMSFGVIDKLFATQKPEYSTASLDEVKAALSGPSVFLTFEYDMDTAFVAGARKSSGESISSVIPAFAHIVITYDLSDNAIVYLCSSDNHNIYRFNVAQASSNVKKIVNSYARQNDNYAFAYELNLDESSDDKREDRLYLSSFVLVNVGVDPEEKLILAAPVFSGAPDEKTCDKIVSSFGLEANSLRRSQDSDGTQKYIENSATITISPKGTITYDAVENQAGITAKTTSQKIESVLAITTKQWSHLFPDSPLSLCVAENMTTHDGKTVISFNYVINGKPVIITENGKCKNGITATFVGDKLINAEFSFSKLTTSEVTSAPLPMLQRFDTAFVQLGIKETVTHAISCYAVNPDNMYPMASTLAVTHGESTGIVE